MIVITEQAIVQAAGMESIDNGVKSQGSATPDSNCSKRTTDMGNVHGKTRIRSPECDIKYLERLSETFIGGTAKYVMAALVCQYRCGSRFKIPVEDLSKNNRRIPVCDHNIRIMKNYQNTIEMNYNKGIALMGLCMTAIGLASTLFYNMSVKKRRQTGKEPAATNDVKMMGDSP